MNECTFINFSGGLDSTYYLWNFLNNNNNNKNIIVHHCVYNKSRSSYENRAVNKILSYLHSKGHSFYYIKSSLDFGYIDKPDYDIVIMLTIAAYICKSNKPIYKFCPFSDLNYVLNKPLNNYYVSEILLPYTLEEYPDLNNHFLSNGTLINYKKNRGSFRANAIFKYIFNNDVNFKILFSNKNIISKRKIVRDLPPELLKLISFCRNPINNSICGKCPACKMNLFAMKQENIDYTKMYNIC